MCRKLEHSSGLQKKLVDEGKLRKEMRVLMGNMVSISMGLEHKELLISDHC